MHYLNIILLVKRNLEVFDKRGYVKLFFFYVFYLLILLIYEVNMKPYMCSSYVVVL